MGAESGLSKVTVEIWPSTFRIYSVSGPKSGTLLWDYFCVVLLLQWSHRALFKGQDPPVPFCIPEEHPRDWAIPCPGQEQLTVPFNEYFFSHHLLVSLILHIITLFFTRMVVAFTAMCWLLFKREVTNASQPLCRDVLLTWGMQVCSANRKHFSVTWWEMLQISMLLTRDALSGLGPLMRSLVVCGYADFSAFLFFRIMFLALLITAAFPA